MAEQLEFTKMHGLGNDFVVLDGVSRPISLSPQRVQRIADRHFGIGCDQLLLVEPASRAEVDFRYRIFNADGGEVEQCGNGARCFARFVHDRGLIDRKTIRVETLAGDLQLVIEDDGEVRVNMGVPRFRPDEIPFIMDHEAAEYAISMDQGELRLGAVSMGNPHAVLRVTDVQRAPVEQLGPVIESHPLFPKRVNAGFMEVISPQHIRLRVYERGVGETLACGSGACAAVAVGRIQNLLGEQVRVELPGGSLTVSWQGRGKPVYMKGPVAYVFEGRTQL